MSNQLESFPSSIKIDGTHIVSDVYGCDSTLLDDEIFLKELIVSSAEKAGATVLGELSHKFAPQGVTAIALLAESHVSIHTWPELGTAAIDVFTCGINMSAEKCIQYIVSALKPARVVSKTIKRTNED
jgi:S-adenosylmethionine decarboxylase